MATVANKPVNVAVVTYVSGRAAAPFGFPARNAAELMVEATNAGGELSEPYAFGSINQKYLWGTDSWREFAQYCRFFSLMRKKLRGISLRYIPAPSKPRLAASGVGEAAC